MAHSFNIHIEQPVLDDLKRRLAATRWPDEISGSGWDYGTNKTYLKELCDYWQHRFNWQQQEKYLNSFKHYKTAIDGTVLHFIQEKSKGKNAIPLLLIHGWPDSFVRFLKLIPLLTNENGLCFDFVVPSIPGYGFSEIPAEKGVDTKVIARLFSKLMTEELGMIDIWCMEVIGVAISLSKWCFIMEMR